MAKKSKIAKNEKRKEIVARYAARRQELKAISRVTPPRVASATAMPLTVVPAVTSASSACPVSASAKWLTAVSFRVFVSPAG